MPEPCTLAQYEEEFRERHLLHGVVAYWAAKKPNAPAIISHERGQAIDWITFDRTSTALALQLVRLGFQRGDFLVTLLPFLSGHILLEYACFKIGVIHAPLDLRLRPAEVLRALDTLKARGFAFLGRTPAADFRELAEAVRQQVSSVEHLIQFSPPSETMPGAVSFETMAADISAPAAVCAPPTSGRRPSVREDDAGASHFHHRFDRKPQARAALPSQHHLPKSLPRYGVRVRGAHPAAGQSAAVSRRRPGRSADDDAVLRRYGGGAGGLRPGPLAAGHCATPGNPSGPDPRHVPLSSGGCRTSPAMT